MLEGIIAILLVWNVLMASAVARLFWWVKVTAHLGQPVRFGSMSGLQSAWRLLTRKVTR